MSWSWSGCACGRVRNEAIRVACCGGGHRTEYRAVHRRDAPPRRVGARGGGDGGECTVSRRTAAGDVPYPLRHPVQHLGSAAIRARAAPTAERMASRGGTSPRPAWIDRGSERLVDDAVL